MKIGSLELQGRTVLAPLAGITHLPFRLIVKRCGCSLVCSEMISAKGLIYNSGPTFRLLDSLEEERPLSVQIFGSEPGPMAKAAAMIEKRGFADIIDINFGCSVKKVVKTGAGVALMKDPGTAEAVIKAVRDSINLPFTIKIRSGWDSTGRQAFEIADIAQAAGVDAIAIHPRTAGQAFRGKADWSLIKKLKERASIPVIGNGDILTPEEGVAMIQQTGCDAVMVGRAAMVDPHLLSRIESLMKGRPYTPPTLEERFRVMEQLLDETAAYFGEEAACKMMRSRLGWFVKGLPGCSRFRKALSGVETRDEALALINGYEGQLADRSFTPDP